LRFSTLRFPELRSFYARRAEFVPFPVRHRMPKRVLTVRFGSKLHVPKCKTHVQTNRMSSAVICASWQRSSRAASTTYPVEVRKLGRGTYLEK
jgi:hypothetical protein